MASRYGRPTGPVRPTAAEPPDEGPPAPGPDPFVQDDSRNLDPSVYEPGHVFYPGESVPKPQEPEPAQQGGGGQPGQCPSGQVWRTDSQGALGTGRPGCEPEDWRSRNDKDTCLGERPNCGKDYDAWCDFSTATWKCGYIGPGPKQLAAQAAAGDWEYRRGQLLKYGHATLDPKTGLLYNVGRGNPNDSSTWQCWNNSTGQEGPCPAGMKPGGAGGAGAGGGGGFGGGGYGSPTEAALAQMVASLGGQFQQFAQQLYGVGFPAYKQGVDYYSTLLGKGGRGAMQAAVAPAAEQIAQGTEGSLRAIGSGYIGGGAKEQAEIAARLAGQGDTARLTQGVQPGAAGALTGAGEAGVGMALGAEGSAAGTFQNLLNLGVSSRLSEAGMALNRDLGFADLDLKRDLGMAGLDFQYASLAESSKQFMAGLGLEREKLGASNALGWASLAQSGSQFQQQLREGQRQFGAGLRFQQGQADQARNDAKMQAIGGAFGQGSSLVAQAALSAAAFKEEIAAPIPPEEALQHILKEAVPALRAWRYRPEYGGRHFDNALVLDLAPRYGLHPSDEHPGGAFVNVLAVLGDLIASVKVLSDQNADLRRELQEVRDGK